MRADAKMVWAVVCLVAGCDSRTPKLVSAAPATLCANIDSVLTLTGSGLDAKTVGIGRVGDMGAPVAPVNAAMVSGKGAQVTATFAANSLTPDAVPYDVVYTDSNGAQLVLYGAVTVVPGIAISAVDPAFVFNGVDFPTSVYGTGMGGVTKIAISSGGTSTELTGVVAVDA